MSPAGRAIQVYAYSEAARHLERALQVQDVLDPDAKAKRCELLLALGDVLMASGEPQRVAEQVAPAAFALAEELDLHANASRACRMALTALSRFGGIAAELTEGYGGWAVRADRYASAGSIDRNDPRVVRTGSHGDPEALAAREAWFREHQADARTGRRHHPAT